MMIDEFERLTGFYPSAEMYEAIEQEYTESRADKYEFCKLYKANEDGVAEKIARKATTMWAKRVGEALLENGALKGKIKQLEADLEQEREWRLFEDKENVSQANYEILKEHGRVLTDDEAAELVENEFGFNRGKIKILHAVEKREINRHKMLRVSGEIERLPIYRAEDWNYVRFDCCGVAYEMDNGNLRLFWH